MGMGDTIPRSPLENLFYPINSQTDLRLSGSYSVVSFRTST